MNAEDDSFGLTRFRYNPQKTQKRKKSSGASPIKAKQQKTSPYGDSTRTTVELARGDEENTSCKDTGACWKQQMLLGSKRKKATAFLQIHAQEVKISNVKLGEGSFGQVFLARFQDEDVAIKTMRIDNRQKALREVKLLSCLNHPNIIRTIGVCFEGGFIVMELMTDGSLKDFLTSKNLHQKPVSMATVLNYSIQIGRGLRHLHDQNPKIIHRDLKPGNVLISNETCKIADFGISKQACGPNLSASSNCHIMHIWSHAVIKHLNLNFQVSETTYGTCAGTKWYIAPEVELKKRYNEKADVYSFGKVMIEMLRSGIPWSKDFPHRKSSVLTGAIITTLLESTMCCRKEAPKSLSKVITNCLQENMRNRPSISTVLTSLEGLDQHPKLLRASISSKIDRNKRIAIRQKTY